MSGRWTIALGLTAALLPAAARADEWPQFRGPAGAGLSDGKQLPTEWGKDKHVAWKAKIPGYGWSQPIVWGDKVFVTTAVTDKQKKPGMGGFGGFGGFGGGVPGAGGGRGGGGGGFPGGAGGGRGGRGGRGFGGFPLPGQIMPSSLQEQLKLTGEQKKQLAALQKDADARLAKILSDEQNKRLKDMRAGFGGGGRGGFGGGRGGFGGGRGGFGGFGGGRPPNAVYRWEVYCLSATDGKVLWKRIAAEGKPTVSINPTNTYATETPVTDGQRVYAYFGAAGVFCYDFTGNLLWQAKPGAYRTMFGHGTASSPALAGSRLFIQCDNEEKSFLLALDAKTGKELWRVARSERTSWSTPLVWKNRVRTEVICLGSSAVRSYDPATGKQLWELSGLSGQPKATPVASADLLYVGSAGFGMFGGFSEGGGRGGRGGKPLYAVKAGACGDITLKDGAKANDGVAWYLPQAGPSTASPLLADGYLYIAEERGGILSCYNARTGKKVYKARLQGAAGFTSSPWAYDGKLFFLDDAGTTFVVQAGPKFKLLASNRIDETFWSSPAVAHGALLLRGVEYLYCIKE